VSGRANELADRLRAAPEVPVSPHAHAPEVIDSVRRILARAGYELGKFETAPSAGGGQVKPGD
jgi:hypothetical protein